MNRPDKLDWWIKWFSSIVLIIGAATTALNMYPYNMYFQFTGIIRLVNSGLDVERLVIDSCQYSRFINTTCWNYTLSLLHRLGINNL